LTRFKSPPVHTIFTKATLRARSGVVFFELIGLSNYCKLMCKQW